MAPRPARGRKRLRIRHYHAWQEQRRRFGTCRVQRPQKHRFLKVASSDLTTREPADCVMLCTVVDAPFASGKESAVRASVWGESSSVLIATSTHRVSGSSGFIAQKSDGDSLCSATPIAELVPGAVRPVTAAGAPGGQEGSRACWEATASEARRRIPDPSTTSEAPGGQDGQAAHGKRRGKAPGRKAAASLARSEAVQLAKRAADDRYARMLEQEVPLSWLVKWIEPATERALRAIEEVPLHLVSHSAWVSTKDGICKAQSAARSC